MNHITEQINRNEAELEKNMPEQGWMPKQITHEEQSDIKLFGYKYFSNGQIHEVTDWRHLKRFLASAQIALLQAVRDKLPARVGGRKLHEKSFDKETIIIELQAEGWNLYEKEICHILDEAIEIAKKNI